MIIHLNELLSDLNQLGFSQPHYETIHALYYKENLSNIGTREENYILIPNYEKGISATITTSNSKAGIETAELHFELDLKRKISSLDEQFFEDIDQLPYQELFACSFKPICELDKTIFVHEVALFENKIEPVSYLSTLFEAVEKGEYSLQNPWKYHGEHLFLPVYEWLKVENGVIIEREFDEHEAIEAESLARIHRLPDSFRKMMGCPKISN